MTYKEYLMEITGIKEENYEEFLKLTEGVADKKEDEEKFNKAVKNGTLKGYLVIAKKIMESIGFYGIEAIRETMKEYRELKKINDELEERG